jgi:hypothetical protein
VDVDVTVDVDDFAIPWVVHVHGYVHGFGEV